MSFPIAFKCELLKTKRTSVVYLAMIAAVIVPFLMMLFKAEEPGEFQKLSKDPWYMCYEDAGQPIAILFLPLFVILITSLVPQLEHRNNTWKQVLASPQTKFNIYFSKFLIIQLLILLFLVMHNLYMVLSVMGVHHLRSDIAIYDRGMNWEWFFRFNGNLYLTVLGLSAFQFWLGVRFRNFIVPLAIGFGLLMAGILLVGAYKWPHGDKYPFAFSLMLYVSEFKNYAFLVWSSIVYAVGFSVIGFWDFVRRRKIGG